ncbi:MAG: (2Fe-2S)-binding protein [Sandaracinus sp.]|nr:(2Fe-2S)-binding protein [Sandaracinus sp.]|tara:strand:- start:1568 stop:2662 length:1095 start_codon:yes stop_codon:yes gene_type:complete
MSLEPRFAPPSTKPVSSAARVLDDWYVACESKALGKEPLAITFLGTPIAVFRRASGEPAAVLDRCPHRNVPLSMGRVRGERLECGYHGWQFDGAGRCQAIPGLCGEVDKAGRNVPAFATRELDGWVWVYGTPDADPEREPYRHPLHDDDRYTTVTQALDMEGSLHATAENALDVPHTAFLHRGLFRQDGDRQQIDVEVRRWQDRVEAEYFGESRPEGVLGKVLAPQGGEVRHVDRFILPCIAQVEYQLGEAHVIATTALTPITDYRTRLFGAVEFRLPVVSSRFVPTKTIGNVLKPLALKVLGQDADALRKQTRNVERFGGEQYVSTEIDVLGPEIMRLLRQAERGARRPPRDEPERKRIQMLV